jgi:hypothetical protein
MIAIAFLKVILPILMTFAALGIACAAWLARPGSRRIGRRFSIPPADPYAYPIGEHPIVPRERQLLAGNFSAWGIPKTSLKPSAAVAHRRNEGGGRPASPSGTAVVLYFPGGEHG